jgi:hypothetical protein
MTSALQFLQLPVDLDQGLPQRFSFAMAGASYDVSLYAAVVVDTNDPLEMIYDLGPPPASTSPTAPPGYLVVRIDRLGPLAATILLRKLVPEPDLVHLAEELAVKLTQARIARGNLNGAGHFGTQIVVGVAQRWA